jgi:hypothetical protein
MSETIANLAQKNARNALQRMEAVEHDLNTIKSVLQSTVKGVSDNFQNLNKEVDDLGLFVIAVSRLLGEDKVRETIQVVVREQKTNAIAGAKKALADAVEQGALKWASTVPDNAILVFEELDAEGNPVEFGRQQHPINRIQPQFRNELMGKEVGTVLSPENSPKIRLIEIYQIVTTEPTIPAQAQV